MFSLMLPQKCQLVIGLGRFMPWTCWEVLLGESRYYLPEKTAKQELAIFYKNIECVVNNRLKKHPFFSVTILVALSGVAMSEI